MGRGSSKVGKLPNRKNAIIPRNKLKNYLLNPSKSPDKAKFFRGLGYNMRNFRRFEHDIRNGLENNNAVEVIKSKYGHEVKAYNVNMELGINKKAIVLTNWQVDEGTDVPRFITAYPAN